MVIDNVIFDDGAILIGSIGIHTLVFCRDGVSVPISCELMGTQTGVIGYLNVLKPTASKDAKKYHKKHKGEIKDIITNVLTSKGYAIKFYE
jgi:hypothetical protein